jgi:hypothetical protein
VRLYGLGVVKDEADVLEQSIRHALRFCDRIVYLDNGSTDGSWELIQRLEAETGGRVVAFGQRTEPFHDAIRGLVYDEWHERLDPDDWWMQLDADEFVEGDPRPALRAAASRGHDRVRVWQAQFAFTDRDLAEWEAGRDDRARPIQERRRWYRADWRESRFWRNDPGRVWGGGASTHPSWADRPAPWALVNRHYQNRDPEQMQRRIADRLDTFAHLRSADWRDYVEPSAELRHLGEGEAIRIDRHRFYARRIAQRLRPGGQRSGVARRGG